MSAPIPSTPALELPIEFAPYVAPVWAFFPELAAWRLAARHMLPGGGDLRTADTGLILTTAGPNKFRIVHAPSWWLH
jgi:hypothetical protein